MLPSHCFLYLGSEYIKYFTVFWFKDFSKYIFFEEQPWFTVKKKKGKSIVMFLLPRWQLPPITSILHQGCIGCYWWARAQSVVYIRVRSWCWLLIFSLLIFCFQFHWFFCINFYFLSSDWFVWPIVSLGENILLTLDPSSFKCLYGMQWVQLTSWALLLLHSKNFHIVFHF